MLAFLTSRLGSLVSVFVVLLSLTLVASYMENGHLKRQLVKAEAARKVAVARADSWQAYGKAERAAFEQSETFRTVEGKRAVAALSEASMTCSARVARARSSALAIATIVNKEPKINANGCPVRELIDPDVLRHALSPRARP